jgi:hypothetical protein
MNPNNSRAQYQQSSSPSRERERERASERERSERKTARSLLYITECIIFHLGILQKCIICYLRIFCQ